MAFVFLLARAFEHDYPWLGYVRAFAEAGMVGALADWFAVVALFRHPLRLPIPHTAIIPRSKDRIGSGLAKFVAENFLASDAVAARLAGADIAAGALARWLARPANRKLFATRAARFVPALLQAFDDDDVQRLVRDLFAKRLSGIELSPVAGELLETLTAHDRHRPLVDEMLQQAAKLLTDAEPEIRQRVRERTGWLWQKLGIDERVSDKLIEAVETTLEELARDPEHTFRAKLDDAIRRFATELRTSPQRREEGEALKARLLDHPALGRYVREVWEDFRAEMTTDAERPDSAIARHLAGIAEGISELIDRDETVRRKLNRWLRGAVLELVESRRDEVAQLIAETVRKWDAETFSRKIEAEVGRDLQYIRINGTLIGGLAGLAIFVASKLIAE
ncbi:MAG: DUF445 domain-containing protein [Myxococcota bacterium]|nr:DUF445 domain-containing protein [Myxococcota bacterium]